MKYLLTQHAQDVLNERQIHQEWIERILENPTRITKDEEDETLEHRLGKIAEYDNRVLRVVVNPQVDPIRVVTVYFDRSLKGKL